MCTVFTHFVNRKLVLRIFVLVGLQCGNWYRNKETIQLNRPTLL